jgi:hypothetical protein
LLSIAPAASSASRVFSEPSRSEAEKTRKETGSRACASTVADHFPSGVVEAYSARRSLAFLILIGPLSYFFGVDSRRSTDRGSVRAAR